MITTVAASVIWLVIGVAVLTAPVLDLVLFAATLPHRFAQFRAERALKRARRTLAEVERESIADGRDRDWHA